MALRESSNLGYGGGEPESPLHGEQLRQSQVEDCLKDQPSSPLNKQNSIFSLTLDEIQLKSGKSFGSMNMDEFLNNLWNNNVEETQVSWHPQPDQNEPQPPPKQQRIDDNNSIIQMDPSPCTLTRQNSFSIPIQISKKTVEEVWSEILKDQPQYPNNLISSHEPPLRQQTFGELTLEEFLIKAGVVQEAIPTTRTIKPFSHQQKLEQAQPIQINNNSTCLDANYSMRLTPNPMMALGFSSHQNVGSNLLVNGYAPYPIYSTPTKFVGVGVDDNIAENDKNHGILETNGPAIKTSRRRIIDGPPEVVVERRQRRMIKNRESAARSRARKQAYTVELELELTQLKEENEKLKQTVKELEQKRAQEILKRLKQTKMARKKGEQLKTLRSTTSSGW